MSYPKTALKKGFFDQVTVTLVLELTREGRVKKATVQGHAQPDFDRAALGAAEGLLFLPATKDGTPIPARILFRYDFEAPPPTLAGKILRDATGLALPGATITIRTAGDAAFHLESAADGTFRKTEVPRGPAELTITARGYEPQSVNITLRPGEETHVEGRLLPRTPASAEQTTVAQPAAPVEVVVQGERPAPAVSSFSRAEVRQMPGAFGDPFRAIEAMPGVTPIASGLPFFYVRGAPPGNVGYFLNGIRVPFLYHVAIGPSVIHPGLVDRVDLYPGGYPAHFGRFAGGIVAAEVTEPRPEPRGEANVRLFDAGALVETGFASGRGTLALGGRYSYTAALFSILVPEVKLDYRDYQARVTYDISNRDRLSVFGFGSYDLLAERQNDGLAVLFGAEFYRLNFGHERFLNDGALRTSLTVGYDQTHMGDEGNAVARSIAARTELRHGLGARTSVRAGAEVSLDEYSATLPKYVDPENPEVVAFQRNNPGRTDSGAAGFADCVFEPASGIEVTAGLRVDWYESQSAEAVALEPRLAARFRVSERLTLLHAYGLSHQPPSFALPLPGRSPAGLEGGLQKSIQTSAGAELELGAATKLKGTLFYNAFFDMTDSLGMDQEGPPDARPTRRSLGSGIGFELFLHRRLTQRLGGLLSYTLSRSTRSLARETFPSSFDRTHVLNAAVSYDLGRSWRAGMRLVFYTGSPELPDSRGLIAPARLESPERTAPFYRVDLRLEKRWKLGEETWVAFVSEIMNTTLSRESFGGSEIGPITIPSVGAELGF